MEQKVPKDLKSYLANRKNKINLVNFVFDFWTRIFQTKLKQDQLVIFANLDGTFNQVSKNQSSFLNCICDHEEADTKMLVVAKYLIDQHQIQDLVIVSPDTDVAVISCYQYATNLMALEHLWLKTGTGDKRRYVAIQLLNFFQPSMQLQVVIL